MEAVRLTNETIDTFSREFLTNLYMQSVDMIVAKYGDKRPAFDLHAEAINGLIGFTSILDARLNSLFELAYKEISSALMTNLLSGKISQEEFSNGQRDLISLYEKSFLGDKILITPVIIQGFLRSFRAEEGAVKAQVNQKYGSRGNRSGSVVYFVQNPSSGKIKIGFTYKFPSRLRALKFNTGEELLPLLTIDGDRKLEVELHKRFSSFRCFGEWFNPDVEILNFIQEQNEKKVGGV